MLNQIPQAGQTLGATRNLVLNNFNTINAAFLVDHVEYNTSVLNNGKHNKVSFPVQGGAPVFSAGDEGLYNLPFNAVNELFVHKQSFAGVKEVPFTASILSTQTPNNFSTGWSYLPSGLLMKWGQVVTPVNDINGGNAAYDATVPFANTGVLSVVLTGINITGTVYTPTIIQTSSTTLNVISKTSAGAFVGSTVNYVAIGRPA